MIRNASARGMLIAEAVLAALIAGLAAYSACRQAGAPTIDELFHMLAARSWAIDGTFAIGDGSYPRAWMFTQLVGVGFSLFGESVHIARAVPLTGAILWALTVFLWTRAFLGRTEAWVVFGLLVLSPMFLELSAFIRFYSWHGFFVFLTFALACVGLDRSKSTRNRALVAVSLIFAIAMAWHLQRTSLIAFGAIGVSLVVIYNQMLFEWLATVRNRPIIVAGMAAALLSLAVWLFWAELPQKYWSLYTWSATWNSDDRFPMQTYHQYLNKYYGLMWGSFPFIALAAAAYRSRWVAACAITFTVAFVIHTFAEMRHPRYIAYALPFFYITVAAGGVIVYGLLHDAFRRLDAIYFGGAIRSHRLATPAWFLCIVIFVAFLETHNSAFQAAISIVSGKDGDFLRRRYGFGDWLAERDSLMRIASEVDVVIAEMPTSALYYLGRVDYSYNRTHLQTTDTQQEFDIDDRIGRPVVSTVESFKKLMNCHESGLILIRESAWADHLITSADVNRFIELSTERLENPGEGDLRAYTWRASIVLEEPACEPLVSQDHERQTR